jgi:hypothetical protein
MIVDQLIARRTVVMKTGISVMCVTGIGKNCAMKTSVM